METASTALFRATIDLSAHVSKKNSRPIYRNKSTNRAFIGKSDRLRNAEIALMSHLRSRGMDNQLHAPITNDLQMLLVFGFDLESFYTLDEKTGELRRRQNLPKLSSMTDSICKSLKAAGIILNASQIQEIQCTRVCTEKTQLFIELRRAD